MCTYALSLLAVCGTVVIGAQPTTPGFDVIPREMSGDIEITSSDDQLITVVTIDSNGETRDGFVDYVFLIEQRPGTDAPVTSRTFGQLLRRGSSLDLSFQNGSKWTFTVPPDPIVAADRRFEVTKVLAYHVRDGMSFLHAGIVTTIFDTFRKRKP